MTTIAIICYVLAFIEFIAAHFANDKVPSWLRSVPLGLAALTLGLFLQATYVNDLHYLNK